MASTTKVPNGTSRKHIKTGLGGAGNHHLEAAFMPATFARYPPIGVRKSSPFRSGIGGAGNICSLEHQVSISPKEKASRDRAYQDSAATNWHHGIGGTGNRVRASDKLKSRFTSHIEERNSRSSLLAREKKLPTYFAEKEYPDDAKSTLSTSSTEYDSESLTSRIVDLKDRVVWRLDRILALGLDAGMQTERPVYSKLVCDAGMEKKRPISSKVICGRDCAWCFSLDNIKARGDGGFYAVKQGTL